jgi:hypothetical protein
MWFHGLLKLAPSFAAFGMSSGLATSWQITSEHRFSRALTSGFSTYWSVLV